MTAELFEQVRQAAAVLAGDIEWLWIDGERRGLSIFEVRQLRLASEWLFEVVDPAEVEDHGHEKLLIAAGLLTSALKRILKPELGMEARSRLAIAVKFTTPAVCFIQGPPDWIPPSMEGQILMRS